MPIGCERIDASERPVGRFAARQRRPQRHRVFRWRQGHDAVMRLVRRRKADKPLAHVMAQIVAAHGEKPSAWGRKGHPY